MFIKTKIPPDYNAPDDTGVLSGTEFRYFDLSEVEDEEDYLSRMHRDGWKLTKAGSFGYYQFESCKPEDVVYRMDFNPDASADRENYLQMYEDYGWECAARVSDTFYFRKTADAASPESNEIFSDSESRLAMMNTIIRKQLGFSIYATVSSTLVVLLMAFQSSPDHFLYIPGLTLCGILLLNFYALLIRRITGFRRFRKKYSIRKVG
jgi:hypothetical protein